MNEALTLTVTTGVYDDLSYRLRKAGDPRTVQDIMLLALREWMLRHTGRLAGRGYQWRDLFLPEGTELRMRYRGRYHHAQVEGDYLVYAGERVSPRAFTLQVTGTVRNPWRDVWVKRSMVESWTQACRLRPELNGPYLLVDRRARGRRRTDRSER